MKRGLLYYNKPSIIIIMLFIIFISCASPCSSTKDVNKNFRVKRAEELQGVNSSYDRTKPIIADTYSQEMANLQMAYEDSLLYLLCNRILSILILAVLLTLYQFDWYMRIRNINIFQMKKNLFMVHYFQLKDGKKNALSFNLSC